MPLINDFRSGDGFYTTKQSVNLYNSANVNPMIVSEQIKNGEGIFSGIGSLISSGVKLATANKDLIQAGVKTTGSVIQAGKNINDAINSTRKVNAEIDNLKKIKKQIELLNNKSNNDNNINNSSLSEAQQNAIKQSLQNVTNKKTKGKGFRIY